MSTNRNSYHTDVKLAVKLGCLPEELYNLIPRSSRYNFKNTDFSNYFGMEFAQQLQNSLELTKQFVKDKQVQKVYRAYIQIKTVITKLFCKIPEKISFEIKQKIVYAIERFRDVIGFEKLLKLFSISIYKFHMWKNDIRYQCRTSLLHRCFRTHPGQLSMSEVKKIEELYHSPEYQGWPIYSVALHAQITGVLSVHVSTWYKYIRIMKLQAYKKHSQYEKPKVGLRGCYPHQYWHADVTILRTLDNRKVYIYFVMDNFSRYILSYRTSHVLSGKIMVDNLKEAYYNFIAPRGSPDKDVILLTDGGPENDCEAVEEFKKQRHVFLKQFIAGQDIMVSNSMVEAVNKVIKYRYLFHQDLADLNALNRYMKVAIPNYNNVKPHYGLKGHTPAQILRGESLNFALLKENMVNARLKRLAENRIASCGVCNGNE